ncbi:MAG: DUF3833 family protein [Silicimonas sp.]|nr:DUF3833 family protein [Silicimonas sp.]
MDTLFAFKFGLLLTVAVLWFAGRYFSFRAQSPEDYADHGPNFDIRAHLNGPLLCDGVIYGPTGRVTSRFVAEFFAEWDGDSGVMREKFRYDSGAVQEREWRLSVNGAGVIRAEADDLVGVGSGRQSGSSVKLDYNIRLPESAGGHMLSVVDWMYLLDNGVIMNRSQFRKFGFKVAELVATMRPATVEEARQEAA